MHVLTKKLKDINITLSFMDMNKNGYYVPEWKIIFINQNLSEADMKLVILHELKHALDHHEYSVLHKNIYYKMKMEKEANEYMLYETIANNDGYFNASLIMTEFGLGIGNNFE